MQGNDTFQCEYNSQIDGSSERQDNKLHEIDIVIKTISNSIYNFKIGTDTTVAELKELIHTATQVTADRQRLIYKGRVLVNESAVSEYHVENGHTIHMVAKPLNHSAPSASDSPSNSSTQLQSQNINAISSTGIATTVNGSVENSGSALNTSIEHIRQGLLSIHTLVSTMDPTDFSYRDNSTNAEAKNKIEVDSAGTGGNDSAVEWISNSFPDGNGKFCGESATDTSSFFKDDDKSRPSKRGRREVNFLDEAGLKYSEDKTAERTKRFFRGQWVDVKDTVSQWLEATIMDIDYENFKVYVHYNGWPERWDEWIAFDSPRISPFRSRTAHSSLNTFLSPTPNILVASAPCTGSNDVRVYLPEFSRLLNMIQPAMEELAYLAEESLAEKPAADGDVVMEQIQHPLILPRGNLRHRGSGAAGAAGSSSSSSSSSDRTRSKAEYFPWENFGRSSSKANEVGCKGPSDVSIVGYVADTSSSSASGRQKAPLVPPFREVESSYSESSSLSRKRPEENSSSYSPNNRSWIETQPRYAGSVVVDSKEAADEDSGDTPQNKKQRQNQRDVRFRHLAKELCPLIDRFGRALTDMAPFLRELAESPVDEGSTSSSTVSAESRANSTSSSSRGSSSDSSRSQFSLEASLLSFLRERPPSPPPERAYRAHITNQPRAPLATGALRANSGSLLTDILNAAGFGGGGGGGGGNAGLPSALVPLSSQSSQGVGGHHLDIHIAILSPPTSRSSTGSTTTHSATATAASTTNTISTSTSSGSALSQAVSNLTASLQAQAQSLALRTQQLNDRTAAVTGYSQAISEILRTTNTSSALASSTNTADSDSTSVFDRLDNSISSIQAQSRSVDLTAQSIRDARMRIQELNRTLSALSSSASQFSSALSNSNNDVDMNNATTAEDPMMQEGNEGDEDEDASENGLLDDLLPPEQVATAVQTDSRLLESEEEPPSPHQSMEMEEVTPQTEETELEIPETGENRGSSANSSPPIIRPPAITPPSVFERIRRSLNFVP